MILHDYFNIPGGGERVVGALAEHMDWPVLAGFVGGQFAQMAVDGSKEAPRTDAWIDRIQTLACYEGLLPLQILSLIQGFKNRSRKFLLDVDTAFYSGTYAPLSVLKSPARANIYYCHSPARFVYDQRDFYLSSIPFWQRPILKWLIWKFQPLYEKALSRMDVIVANSENVRRRLNYYLGLDAVVVHPPCDTQGFRWLGQSDFYLSTARLDPLKRVDLVVEAFRHMPEKQLVVVSGGSGEEKIRKAADGADNIQVLGWVSEDKLKELVGTCIATIYIPRDEDFGMSPVESMAAGKPVIGVQEGGLLETVGDETTRLRVENESEAGVEQANPFMETSCGLLLRPRPEPLDLVAAVQWLTPERALEMSQQGEKRAQKFGIQAFTKKIAGLI